MKASPKTVVVLLVSLLACIVVGAIVFFLVLGAGGEKEELPSDRDSAVEIFGNEITDDRSVSPVQDILIPHSPTMVMQRIIGLDDVLAVFAGIYVCIVVIYFWISRTIKDRKDPTKQWLK